MENLQNNSQGITKLLNKWKKGEKDAFDELFPIVYDELRRRASSYLRNERKGHTLQTTALVNEAYLNLVDTSMNNYEDRNHFFAIAANAMRRILVHHARTKNRKKRGGKNENLPLEEAKYVSVNERSVDLVALDESLNELAEYDERQAKIVELKYFGGMTTQETADILGISNVTVRRDWKIARTWLFEKLKNK